MENQDNKTGGDRKMEETGETLDATNCMQRQEKHEEVEQLIQNQASVKRTRLVETPLMRTTGTGQDRSMAEERRKRKATPQVQGLGASPLAVVVTLPPTQGLPDVSRCNNSLEVLKEASRRGQHSVRRRLQYAKQGEEAGLKEAQKHWANSLARWVRPKFLLS